VKKGISHSSAQRVLWTRAINDGLVKRKGKRLPDPTAQNDYARIAPLLKAFIQNPAHPVKNVLQFQKACPIDFNDPLLELVPENYLDQAPPSDAEVTAGIESVARDTVSYIVRAGKEHKWA
jgi:hypothetical protein